MELSRKEEYRNKKISLAVTLFSFATMVSFFVFKTILIPVSSGSPSLVPLAALGFEANLSNNQGNKGSLTAFSAATQKNTSSEKLITDPQGVSTPLNTTTREIVKNYRKYKPVPFSPKNDTSEMDKQGDSKKTGGDLNTLNAGGNPFMGFNLLERTIVSAPAFSQDMREQGKVVVEILVDQNGNVLEADPNGRGTTTSSFLLKNEARKMALATKFSENQKFEEQKGTITIIFTFH